MASASISVASRGVHNLGEGPHWDEVTKTLLYLDCFVGDVYRLDPETKAQDIVHFENDVVTVVVPYASNPLKTIITRNTSIWELDWTTRKSGLIKIVEPENGRTRFNDGKCDAAGRLWAGTMSNQGDGEEYEKERGSLYRLDSDFSVHKMQDRVSLSNGMAWTKDGRNMFYIDSIDRKVYVYDFDLNAGTISNRRILLDYDTAKGFEKEELPDGMTIDVNDKIWVACWDGARIVQVDSETGQLLKSISIPSKRTTSCCFGGPNLDELYVTSARKGLSESHLRAFPQSGSVFKITGLGVKGLPANGFKTLQ